MMRGIKLTALSAALIAACFFGFAVRPGGIVDFYRDTLTPTAFILWCIGGLAATLAPPVVAIAFWYGAGRIRHGWFLHFLLVPVTYALVRVSIAVMLRMANEPDRDGLTGWAIDPAIALMLVCPIVYFLMLGVATMKRRRLSDNSL